MAPKHEFALPIPAGFSVTLEIVDRVCRDVGHVSHSFMESEKFKEILASDVPSGSKIYWRELLARVHIGAHLSLLRAEAWLTGADAAWRAGNLLLYSAGLRGLLEATADSWFAFRNVPLTLARHHYRIALAIRGKSKRLHLMGEVEDSLIHFTHARRLPKHQRPSAPKSHDAMHIQDYLRSFGGGYEKAAILYDRLCAFTHPAAESLMLFVEDYVDTTWSLTRWDQKELVKEFHTAFQDDFVELLFKGLNVPITLLKLLNTFKDSSFNTPGVASVDLSRIPAWGDIERAIEASARAPDAQELVP